MRVTRASATMARTANRDANLPRHPRHSRESGNPEVRKHCRIRLRAQVTNIHTVPAAHPARTHRNLYNKSEMPTRARQGQGRALTTNPSCHSREGGNQQVREHRRIRPRAQSFILFAQCTRPRLSQHLRYKTPPKTRQGQGRALTTSHSQNETPPQIRQRQGRAHQQLITSH